MHRDLKQKRQYKMSSASREGALLWGEADPLPDHCQTDIAYNLADRSQRNVANQFNPDDDSANGLLEYAVGPVGVEHGESLCPTRKVSPQSFHGDKRKGRAEKRRDGGRGTGQNESIRKKRAAGRRPGMLVSRMNSYRGARAEEP